MPLISIVIPVYNAEIFLQECFESIAAQTYKKLEIIFVDDGSTDNSYKICQQFASQDYRVRVFTKKNGGQNSARRLGVEKSRGEYIGFVDADDWINTNMYQKMLDMIQKYTVDIVICGLNKVYINGKIISQRPSITGIYEGEFLVSHFFIQEDCFCSIIPGTLYTALFSKDIITDSIHKIDYRINYSEDFAWLAAACISTSRVGVIGEELYFYRINQMSITNMHNKSNVKSQKILFRNMVQIYNEHCISDEAYVQLAYMIVRDMMMGGYDYFLEKYDELFPYKGVSKKLKIVLYGAGQYGTEMYSKITMYKSNEIVAWVDRNWKMYDSEKILPVEYIKNYKFDYIVIAVLKRSTSQQIKSELIRMGIDECKIAAMDRDLIKQEVKIWSDNKNNLDFPIVFY